MQRVKLVQMATKRMSITMSLVYIAYLGKEHAESLMRDERETRNVMQKDSGGVIEYHSTYKEAELFLLGLSESEVSKMCKSFFVSNGVPGFMQRPKN